MKDRVFIVWSGTNQLAKRVASILEQKQYVCIIGGNEDNNSQCTTIGDTVLRQIRECNQAIVIFQKRSDNEVSRNLFFELGYVLASYGTTKVHCVRRASEEIALPSDFDNSFVEPIFDDGLDEKELAASIVDYFMRRQKMDIPENKMYLINNRYLIHDKITSHYSDNGSKCSDYELAQYLLFYMQAAHMFGDEKKVYDELFEFKNRNQQNFSRELSLAVNMTVSFLSMVSQIKMTDDCEAYIDEIVFGEFEDDYRLYEREGEKLRDNVGCFGEWALVFVHEQMAYCYMLSANNEAFDKEDKDYLINKQKEYANKAIVAMEELEKRIPSTDNNDRIGLLSLLRAYVYRNMFLAKEYLQEADAGDYLKKTMEERESLHSNFKNGTIDSQLYETFCMEYYLAIANYFSFVPEEEISRFEKRRYRRQMLEYLDSIKKQDSVANPFVKQIEKWCNEN